MLQYEKKVGGQSRPVQTMLEEKDNTELSFEVQKEANAVTERVRQSPEVQAIVRKMDITNTQALLTFGKEASEEIASFSDGILRTIENTKSEDAGKMLVQLKSIMQNFDIKDFEKENPGLIEKIFKRAKNSIDAIFKKYHTMGDEIDKVHIQLRQFEHEINKANDTLNEMFSRNLTYYEDLKRYIVAGEMASEEIATRLIPEWEEKAQATGDQYDVIAVQNLHQAKDMLDQRVFDLKLAENIALQSMPMIKSIEFGNYNLVRKINSAFVITLPIFKQNVAQAIMVKRQAIQSKSLQALDNATNEMLLKNAQNTATQTKLTAQLATKSFVEVETLQKTWETIMQGIEETKQITLEGQQKRKEEALKLEEFKKTFEETKVY